MNKQIDEMAIALHESQHEYDKAWHECFQNKGKLPERENVFYAKYLVEKKGYRKASEVAREIFAEIERIMSSGNMDNKYEVKIILSDEYSELKKKYEVTDDGK